MVLNLLFVFIKYYDLLNVGTEKGYVEICLLTVTHKAFINLILHMGEFGLYSDKSSSATTVRFETHLNDLESETKELLLDLRKFVKSFGDNVIEEVRPHRIVYAKSLTFRYFLDIRPRKNILMITVRRSRKEPSIEYAVTNMVELQKIKPEVSEAYMNI